MTTAHRTKLGDGNVAGQARALPQGETVPITITLPLPKFGDVAAVFGAVVQTTNST